MSLAAQSSCVIRLTTTPIIYHSSIAHKYHKSQDLNHVGIIRQFHVHLRVRWPMMSPHLPRLSLLPLLAPVQRMMMQLLFRPDSATRVRHVRNVRPRPTTPSALPCRLHLNPNFVHLHTRNGEQFQKTHYVHLTEYPEQADDHDGRTGMTDKCPAVCCTCCTRSLLIFMDSTFFLISSTTGTPRQRVLRRRIWCLGTRERGVGGRRHQQSTKLG